MCLLSCFSYTNILMSRYQTVETDEKEKKEKSKKARIRELIKKEEELVTKFVLLEKQHQIIIKSKKEMIVEWAKILEELSTLGYYQWPIHTICNYMCHVVQQRGYSISTPYVIEVLESKYKDPDLSYAGTVSAEVRVATINTEREIIKVPELIEHNVTYSQMSPDELRNVITRYDEIGKKTEKDKKTAIKNAEFRGIPVPKESTPDTISTDKETEKQTTMSKALRKMHGRMNTFTDSIKELAVKVEEFPPDYDKGVQDEISDVIDIFCDQIIEPFNSFLQPLKDEKWSQSWPKWWKTQILNLNHGKHAAATMSAGMSHLGQKRSLTREQCGDVQEKAYNEAIKFSRAVQMFMHLNEYHEKFIQPRIMDRKIRMSSKLSESA